MGRAATVKGEFVLQGKSVFVGGQVFVAYSDRRQGNYYLSVIKVGRKWVTLSDGSRFSIETRFLDSVSQSGRVYLNHAAYVYDCERTKAWNTLVDKMRLSFRPPEHISKEEIERLIKQLEEN